MGVCPDITVKGGPEIHKIRKGKSKETTIEENDNHEQNPSKTIYCFLTFLFQKFKKDILCPKTYCVE